MLVNTSLLHTLLMTTSLTHKLSMNTSLTHTLLVNTFLSHKLLMNTSLTHTLLVNTFLSHKLLMNSCLTHTVLVNTSLLHTLLMTTSLTHKLSMNTSLTHTLLVNTSLSPGKWSQLPDMLYQETAPAVTQHRSNIYVFKNYAQVFHIPTNSWSFLELTPPVPGLPLFTHPDPTTTSGIFVSCFNSESLWLVDAGRRQSQLVVNFQKEGGGGVFHRGRVFHFQLHDFEFGMSKDMQVECYSTLEASQSVAGVLPGAVLSAHFVTVPHFPRYTPSSKNQLC